MGYTTSQPGRYVWLLQVQYAGQIYRWATEPIDLLKNDGTRLSYEGGLDVELDEDLELFDDAPTPPSVSFRNLPMRDDLTVFSARGATFRGNPGELSILRAGDLWEQRHVRVSGTVRGAAYGAHPRPVAFTLEGRPFDDSAPLLDPRHKVTAETWPLAPSRSLGRFYPAPIGTPGVYREADGSDGKTYGSPVIKVDDTAHTAIVADGEVSASTVQIIRADEPDPAFASASFALTTTTDALGVTVTVADLSSSSLVGFEDGDEYYARWDNGSALLDDDRQPIIGAGDLARWALRRTNIEIDTGALQAARPRMNQIKMSGYVDDGDAGAWELVFRAINPLLLISWIRGPKGLVPIQWDPDLVEADAQFRLEHGRNCLVSEDIVEPMATPINQIDLGFSFRADTGKPRRRLMITGAPTTPYVPRAGDVFSTTYSRASLINFGPGAVSMESAWLYDVDSAALMLQRAIRVRGFLWQDYEIALDLADWRIRHQAPPRLGSQGLLTVAPLRMTATPVVLVGLSWVNDQAVARVVRIPDFLREIAPAG